LNLKGHVTVAIVVKADGTIANDLRVVAAHPAGRGFEEAALDAVHKWRFNPAVSEGKPVESRLTLEVEFE
jgi:protein TonB